MYTLTKKINLKSNIMQSRIEIFKSFVKEANPNKGDFSYSAVMRKIRKEHPEKIKVFMKAFKDAFDTAQDQNIEGLEQTALMQAVKSIGL